MAKATIYRFKLYDIGTDENQMSRRWGTREAIARVHGQIIEESAIEVDAEAVNSDSAGLTARDFNPHAKSGGFQQKVQ